MVLPDTSGFGNHGTITGPIWVGSSREPALDFDGNDDYVDIGYIGIAPPLSLEFLVKMESLDSYNTLISEFSSDLFARSRAGYIQFFIDTDDVNLDYRTTTDSVEIDVWMHLVFVAYTDLSAKIFRDGAECDYGSAAQGTGTADSIDDLTLGKSSDAFDGQMALCRMYNRALSVAEVAHRYEIVLGRGSRPTRRTFFIEYPAAEEEGGVVPPVAFGEQSPSQGETAVSWATWSDGAGGAPTISGDADWGKLQLLSGEEGRSQVYDMGSIQTLIWTVTENRYGTGSGTAQLQIRGSTTSFAQDDVTPSWENYSGPVEKTWRYVQVRETKS
jgi:hypothetical protein